MARLEHFDGETFEFSEDSPRLTRQLDLIRSILRKGRTYTLAELSDITGYPQNSISARIRDLRKPRFGGHDIKKRRSWRRNAWVYWWSGGKSQVREVNHTGASQGGRHVYFVEDIMMDGQRHTIEGIASKLGIPPTSAAVAIRKLRMPENGGYYVQSRRLDNGLWDYLLVPDVKGRKNAKGPSGRKVKRGRKS